MFEAYTIGIRLSLVGNVGQGLMSLSLAFLKTEAQAAKLQKRIQSIQGMAIKSGALMGAGLAIAASFKPAVDQAIQLEQAMNRLKALNLGSAGQNSIVHQALGLSRNVKGTSYAEALRLATETQTITGNLEHTQDLLPMLAKIRFGVETYMAAQGHGQGQGAVAEQQFRDIVKVMELRGLMRDFSQDKANAMGDLFVKSFIASGGQVRPSDYLAMLKTGGVAGKLVNADFMLALGHMMQESGGHRTGTALMSTYQNLIAGRTTQQVAEQLNKFGLLAPGSIEYGTTGHIKKIKPGALQDSELLQSNPLDYMNKVLLPRLAAKGIDINDQSKVIPALNTLVSNRTASNFFSQLYMDRGVIANYLKQAHGAAGVNALYDQGTKSTVGNLADMQAKFNTLLAALGTSILPVVNRALELLIPKMQAFTDFMMKHPTTFKWLADGLIGLAGALTLFGSIGLIASGFRALGIALAFQAVGGVSGLFGLARAMSVFGKAMLFSQIGGAGGIVNAAKNFGLMTTALGVLSQAAAVFAAAYIGWKIGGAINNSVVDPSVRKLTGDKSDTLGGVLFDLWNPYNSATGKREFRPWSSAGRLFSSDPLSRQAEAAGFNSVMPRAGGQTVQVHSTINLDGRKVGQAVTEHQTQQATSPQTGTSYFDPSQYASPIGINAGY